MIRQGATPRCDAEVRRQGATPTCPRPRMCVYCLLCMSNRLQSLSRRAVCGVGVYFLSLCVFIDLLRSPSLCRDGVYFLSLFLYVCLCVYDLHAQGNRRQSLSRRAVCAVCAVCGVGNDEAQSKKKQRSNHTHITMNHLLRRGWE